MRGVFFYFVTVPYGVSGQLWYLIVLISGFCSLIYFYIGKTNQIFLSETTMPSTLIFGMQHHVVRLYQFYLIWSKGLLSEPACELACSVYESIGEIFFSDTTRHRTLIFVMQHHLVYLFLVCSHNGPCAKTGPTLRLHVLQRLIYGTLKLVYSETTEPRVYIWYVASSSRRTKFF